MVSEEVGGGTDTVLSAVSFSLAGTELENLQLTGTGAINATGSAVANVLTGNRAANTLDGGDGNDTLVGNGGADVLLGGAGDDLLKVSYVDNDRGAMIDFFKIDGGTGIDTLEFTATGTMDFTSLRNDLVENVEIFKLGAGNQNITLNHMDVLSITGETNTAIENSTYQKGHVLVVDGSAGDTLNLVGGWTSTAVAQVNVSGYSGHSFSVYQHGSDNLYVAISDGIDAASRHIS